ncbi:hypothetical protein DSLASN_48320 [Desulfoluna limicola]|uniref:Uncharacterized protein n=2 Tax=Desulfoluna limicola TaxID=2810562 RepID=A0ABN6FE13_9BACT|nr:hypothetical protein DSLASN_48320 [Desulfoluna limicola]
MPNAYLVEIHRFLARKKKEAETGLNQARSAEEKAFHQGILDELTLMKGFVSEKYDMDFHDYGEAV